MSVPQSQASGYAALVKSIGGLGTPALLICLIAFATWQTTEYRKTQDAHIEKRATQLLADVHAQTTQHAEHTHAIEEQMRSFEVLADMCVERHEDVLDAIQKVQVDTSKILELSELLTQRERK